MWVPVIRLTFLGLIPKFLRNTEAGTPEMPIGNFQDPCCHREREDLKEFPKSLRHSIFARVLALALLVVMPFNGAYPQTSSDTNSTATPAQPADASQTPAPATPATPADATQPVTSGDMSTPGASAPATPADQGAAPTDQAAVPGDQTAPSTPGHRTKKLVTAPDEAAPIEGDQGPIVRAINIQYIGPKTVSQAVILSNMRTTVGEVYSAASVEEDVRNLYATGFFTNLAIKDEPMSDGVQVNVIVQPKPLVKQIVINGAKKIKVTRLKKEIKSKIGEPLSEEQISEDADKIKDYYLGKGYDQVQVSYKIDTNEEYGRSLVTFNVVEGERAYVTQVNFIGNDHLTAKELRKVMKTKKKDILSFIDKSGLFKEDQFHTDLDNLRTYYNSKGYIDMSIKDVKFVRDEKGRMQVTITVFEGIQYTVGKIDFTGNTIYTKDQLRQYRNFKVIRMTEGMVYSPRAYTPEGKEPNADLPTLENDTQRIRDLYGVRGYIDMDVTPIRQANVDSGKIDILYQIVENSQSYVEQIIIQGNNRTKDKVIRRELANAPGEIYDSVKAAQSKKRLENLQYFDKVDISPQSTTVPNRKNMVVTVEEKRTGSVTFGAGFSSVDSLLGFVEITQGNFDLFNFPYFTGGGEKFRVRLQYGIDRQDVEVEFKEPWFLEQKIALGYNLFFHNYDYNDGDVFGSEEDVYNQEQYGASVSLARAFGPFWSGSVTYTIQQYDLYDFASNTSPELLREQGNRSDSSISLAMAYDTRDSVLLTRHGTHADISAEVAGGPLLGQTEIYKFQADAQHYILLPYDMILTVAGATGVVNDYGNADEVPLFDRFFIGGSRSIRGFDNRDIGPVDNNDVPLGGNTMAYTNLELTFPIMDRVRGAIFNDAGFLDARFLHYTDAIQEGDAAAGVGLRLNLPIGPLRLDWGVPYKDQGFNHSKTGKFSFDVGYQF
jgi:outer membrane protein insertion porin family